MFKIVTYRSRHHHARRRRRWLQAREHHPRGQPTAHVEGRQHRRRRRRWQRLAVQLLLHSAERTGPYHWTHSLSSQSHFASRDFGFEPDRKSSISNKSLFRLYPYDTRSNAYLDISSCICRYLSSIALVLEV